LESRTPAIYISSSPYIPLVEHALAVPWQIAAMPIRQPAPAERPVEPQPRTGGAVEGVAHDDHPVVGHRDEAAIEGGGEMRGEEDAVVDAGSRSAAASSRTNRRGCQNRLLLMRHTASWLAFLALGSYGELWG
jgi:hypothetical protein